MKIITVFISMFIFPMMAYAQPQIMFDEEAYDMGELTQEIAMHSFKFKNVGSSELILEKPVPS
ncbi:MAG: hypothetical protein HY754_03165 [Nitrospirae bacterium]|nr:hypothetical protein [Nitrospirota bacterium]